jgi:hypothetical protein
MNGIRAVLQGKDIDSGNPLDYAFSSTDVPLSVPLLGLSFSGNAGYTFANNPPTPGSGQTTTTLFTYTHALGYTPMSLVYVFVNFAGTNPSITIPDNSYYLPPTQLVTGDFPSQWIQYYVDDNQLVIYYEIDSGGAGYTDVTGMELTFKYYLFSNVLE